MNNIELKQFRERHKINQEQLAEIVGKTIRAVQSWEQGIRNIPQSVILLLNNFDQNSGNKKDTYLTKDTMEMSVIKNKPHDEQMEILYNKIDDLENTVKILKERDQLYFKAIIAHLGIDTEETIEIKENKKSSTN